MGDNADEKWDQLSKLAGEIMEKQSVPGVVVGILYEGEVRAAGFGVTNVDHPLPVTAETLFQVGSITKTFTVTAMMRLVEMGKLDLEATVRTYVPGFKVADEAVSSQVTVRHLLTHTAGWFGDYFLDTGAGDDAMARYVSEMAELEQVTPQNALWSYNNAGFYLAGHIIELVTGQRYEEVLQELVLEPLALARTFFDPGDVMTHRFAVGHRVGDEGAEVARPWPLPRAAYPAGGITCSVDDLLRYAGFHMGDGATEEGTRLLTPASLSLMQTTQTTIWGDETFGLGWFLKAVDGADQVGHGGGTTGQISLLVLVPEHKFAIAVFTNADRGSFVTDEVTGWAMKHYLGAEIAEPEPIETSEEALAAFAGRYDNPFAEIELGILGGQLVAQLLFKRGFPSEEAPIPPPPPPMTLTACEKDRLLVLDGPSKGNTIHAGRKADGSVDWLRVRLPDS
jgi:CubicO group peptidase (beta-lactamase class C family)